MSTIYYRKPNLELLHTTNGKKYLGYSFYGSDRMSLDDIQLTSSIPSNDKVWYIDINGDWNDNPTEASLQEMVVGGFMSLDEAKIEILKKLDIVVSQKTQVNFVSNVLGSPHIYETTFIDQFNAVCSVLTAMITSGSVMHRCVQISDGKDEFRPHTREQIFQVFIEGKTHIEAYLHRRKILTSQILLSETIEELTSIDLNYGW